MFFNPLTSMVDSMVGNGGSVDKRGGVVDRVVGGVVDISVVGGVPDNWGGVDKWG